MHFLGPFALSRRGRNRSAYDPTPMHLRSPSVDQGVQAGLWAVGLGLLIWLGMLSVGVSGATAVIMAALAGAVIFFYVRLFGGDKPKPRRTERS